MRLAQAWAVGNTLAWLEAVQFSSGGVDVFVRAVLFVTTCGWDLPAWAVGTNALSWLKTVLAKSCAE